MHEHRTEVDDWTAVWLIVRHAPRMMLVSKSSETEALTCSETPITAPDLAQMREQFPRLEKLWDAVQHEFWSELFPPQHTPSPPEAPYE